MPLARASATIVTDLDFAAGRGTRRIHAAGDTFADLAGQRGAAWLQVVGAAQAGMPGRQLFDHVVGDAAPYLIENMSVDVSVHEGVGIAIVLPQRAVFEVVETEPTTKGQTASSSYKPALLSNGVKTTVPPHIATGTRIVVMTADGSYVERAKD